MVAPVVFLSGFKVGVVNVVNFETASGDAQNLKTSTKHEQVLCMTSCEFHEQAAKPKFQCCIKLDLLSTIHNKMIARGKKLETSVKLRVSVLNLSLPRLMWQYTRYGFLFLIFCLL